jgi:hypothetical protein
MSGLSSHLMQLVGIAKNWALQSLPGWSDDVHRDILSAHGGRMIDGRVSARTMTTAQLSAVLDDYEHRGWPRDRKPFKVGDSGKAVPPDIKHIVRLWGRLADIGRIDDASRSALLVWAGRQLGIVVKDLDSLTTAERQSLIEGLKAWAAR